MTHQFTKQCLWIGTLSEAREKSPAVGSCAWDLPEAALLQFQWETRYDNISWCLSVTKHHPRIFWHDTSRVKIPSHLFYINLTALVTQKFQKNDKTAKTMSELGHSSYLLSEWKEPSRIFCTILYFSWNSKSIYCCTNEYRNPPFHPTPTFAMRLFWWSGCCWICISVRPRGEKS